MKLVVNMISHNDAIYLPVVIPALQLFTDRILIFDNGSVDESAGIAKDLLRPHDLLYRNYDNDLDFSCTRNSILEQCEDGDWIFKWDTDELPSDQMVEKLEKLISKREEVGWGVPCYHIMKEPRQCLPMEYGFSHMCLFKKTPSTRWIGSVHEHVAGVSGPTANIPLDTGISIIHLSYFAETRFKKKAEVYARLPNSGFKSPMDLIGRLSLQPLSLPHYVTYTAAPEWLEKLRTAP
jgi:glycosyltransferase involved in cell wall biosynthesis